jgi:NAD(P)-dependent dehydrogenase (short-subunit alcohol dehydrogenase family)
MSAPVALDHRRINRLGRAAALAFAKAGNRVVVSCRTQDAGEALVGELRARPDWSARRDRPRAILFFAADTASFVIGQMWRSTAARLRADREPTRSAPQ